ncbi:MAG TPA: chemotaxis protein CheA [Vicinamibacteria bacterium]|nr:chemotaxis protein CheA [Vicinamibacteria bacterium]
MSSAALDDGFLTPDEIQELRQTLFDQGRVALDALGPAVLELEGHRATPERLKPLRRAAHTLKGDCASVGFEELSRLAHALEDAFTVLEEGRTAVSAEQADVLLSAVDHLAAGLEAGVAGRPGPEVHRIIGLLQAIGALHMAADTFVLAPPQAAEVAAALSVGQHAVRLSLQLPGRRRADSAVRALLQAAELREVARAPGSKANRLDLVALGPLGPAEVEARLRRRRQVKVQVERWHPRPSLDDPSPSAEPAREGESVRIDSRRVDEVLNLIGEMVTARSTIAGVTAEIAPVLSEELASRLADAQSLLERVLQDLQRSAMRMRMVPVGRVLRRFSRVVRDLGRQSGKRVLLQVEGEGTELDRAILDALEEPLLHLVRNAVDHGLESAEERRAAGKPEEGRVWLRASREGNQVLVEVADDGRGIDAARVRRSAIEKSLVPVPEAEALSPEDALQLVFRAGLSTAPAITETSGRGVGLDIVRQKVEALKGSIHAANTPGSGASFLIRVPLTVAIIRALLFRAGSQHLAVPLTAIVEIARADALAVQRVGPQQVFRLRDAALGLVALGTLLEGAPEAGPGFVIVLQSSVGRFGILVDEVIGEQELVIKAVHDRWIRTSLVAGASVLGGGTLALILDVLAIHRAALGGGAPRG